MKRRLSNVFCVAPLCLLVSCGAQKSADAPAIGKSPVLSAAREVAATPTPTPPPPGQIEAVLRASTATTQADAAYCFIALEECPQSTSGVLQFFDWQATSAECASRPSFWTAVCGVTPGHRAFSFLYVPTTGTTTFAGLYAVGCQLAISGCSAHPEWAGGFDPNHGTNELACKKAAADTAQACGAGATVSAHFSTNQGYVSDATYSGDPLQGTWRLVGQYCTSTINFLAGNQFTLSSVCGGQTLDYYVGQYRYSSDGQRLKVDFGFTPYAASAYNAGTGTLTLGVKLSGSSQFSLVALDDRCFRGGVGPLPGFDACNGTYSRQ